MKKTLLLCSIFISSVISLRAQCTISPGCSTATTGYCSTPASGTSLPNATELMGYSTTIQVSLGNSFSGITINSATVTAVSGLPTGMSYSLNPSSGVIQGGGNGCMLVTGTPAAATAGSYTITADITVTTSLAPISQTATWLITVDPALSGINSMSATSTKLRIMPNPASNNITVTGNATDNSNIQVSDILGNNLMQTNLQNGKANIDISNLQSGVYFITSNKGTQKFIKQ